MIDRYFQQLKENRWFCIVILLVAIFNISLIRHYPAASPSDSIAYLKYADLIVQSFATGDFGWAKALDLGEGTDIWVDRPDYYRMIGYPLVIAVTKFLGGDGYQEWLQGLQSVVSLIATVMVYGATLCVAKHKGWATIGALAFAFSPMIFVENAVLTDSIYSSFLAMALCLSVISFYRDSAFYRRCLTIGVLLGLAFLIREATTIVLIVFLPVFLAPIWFAKIANVKKMVSVLLIFLPIFSAFLGYGTWNQNRSGHFFSTVFQPPYPVIEKYRQGVPSFSYGQPIDAGVNKTIQEFNAINGLPEESRPPSNVTETWEFIGRIYEVMREDFGYDQYDMFVVLGERAIRVMIDHPVAAVKFALREMLLGNPNGFPPVMGMALSPLTEIALLEQVSLKKQPRSIMAVVRAIQSGNYTALDVAEVGVRILFRLIPLGIILLYLALAPIWLIFMRSRGAKETVMMASIWVIFAGMSCVYSLYHFEVRYVLGALPSQIICAVVCAQFISDKILRKYRAGYSTKNA